jgi:hypothetical protein
MLGDDYKTCQGNTIQIDQNDSNILAYSCLFHLNLNLWLTPSEKNKDSDRETCSMQMRKYSF